MPRVVGGRTLYGYSIGILMLEAQFPRIPGDLGNASTFPYPVLFQVVRGASPERVVLKGDQSLLEPFIVAARELERGGVRAITTNCGFLAMFQPELAAAVRVPVFTSSLMLVPLVSQMLAAEKRVGILTVHGASLGERHWRGLGWSPQTIPVAIRGLESYSTFTQALIGNAREFSTEAMEADIVTAATDLSAAHPDLGAIVFECTNMAPYAHAVQAATGLPVFDIQTLLEHVYSALHRRPYSGEL
jgi:Asp/Glu/hydantoin racemase